MVRNHRPTTEEEAIHHSNINPGEEFCVVYSVRFDITIIFRYEKTG